MTNIQILISKTNNFKPLGAGKPIGLNMIANKWSYNQKWTIQRKLQDEEKQSKTST